MSRKRSLPQSFKYAGEGLSEMFRNEPNFIIHTIAGVSTVILAIFFRFSVYEWLLLTFTITFVLVMEMVNTVLENLVDLVSPDKQLKAKVAKDVAAAGVLSAAIMSLIVAGGLFIPKFLSLLS